MRKDLTEMTLAELWELFPIALVAPRPEWQLQYNEIEARLERLLAPFEIVRISHIGSTAIPGIWAKNIVDILVEVAPAALLDRSGTISAASSGADIVAAHADHGDDESTADSVLDAIAAVLEADGFLLMSRADARVSLNLGYTPDGFADKVYHVHLRYAGDNDELYFRDYLMDHPEVAHDYEQLKQGLWHTYEFDRDAYTAAKGEFIRKWTAMGRAAYPGRYSC